MKDINLSEIIYPELKTTYRLNYSETNFHIWRDKLDFVLKENKVNYVLTERKPSKDNQDEAASHDKWVADDFKARHIILGTLHDHLYMSYHEHETAKSIMDGLTRLFTRPSMAKRINLFRRYMNHRMEEGTSIDQHIIEMFVRAKELELEGVKVPQEFQAVALMESLPESWEDEVRSITWNLETDEEGLGLDNVCKKLRSVGGWKEYYYRRARDDDDASSSKDGSRGGFKGKCFSCGEFGHRKYDCPN
ncbi:hypothetical protein PTKIN_Ptkin11bG0006000 [Pterospermum kingtungense]